MLLKYKIFMVLVVLVCAGGYLFSNSFDHLPKPFAGALVFAAFAPFLLTLLLSRGFELIGLPSLFMADGNWIMNAPTKPGMLVVIGISLLLLYGVSVLIAKIVAK